MSLNEHALYTGVVRRVCYRQRVFANTDGFFNDCGIFLVSGTNFKDIVERGCVFASGLYPGIK